ncbi:MAG: hypothetical protein LBC83_05440 [Oscillospiraceae bacterium]|nr:hypothetical protein [Oscillospiraceae bacterium]
MKRIYLSVILLGCLLCVCVGCAKPWQGDSGKTTATAAHRVQPQFLDFAACADLLNTLPVDDANVRFTARSEFLFLQMDRYVIRYSVRENRIDAVVDLGNPVAEGWTFGTSYSQNGRYMISVSYNAAVEDPTQKDGAQTGRNYILLDFEEASSEWLADAYSEHAAAEATKRIPQEVAGDYYNLLFSVDDFKSELLQNSNWWKEATQGFNRKSCAVLDENRAGIFLPHTLGQEAVLGDYEFAILDLRQDVIAQRLRLKA